MPRDSSGNYTSPSANFVAGTTILVGPMNGKLNDIESEITDSLSRNGDGAMLAPMRVPNGTSNLPAYAFSTETTLGIYRSNTADLRVANNGTDLFKWTATENRSLQALKVSTGGLTVDAGGLTVTAGGGTITAGGLTVSAGGAGVTGTLPAVSGVAGASSFTASGTMSTTSGESHALTTVAKATSAGPNVLQLNARSKNTGAVTSWDQVDVGLSYDVDNTVGSGGSLYFGKAGAKLTGATAATGADPTNALELTNGNLKLSGTAPNKDEALANTLTPANICKAWAYFSVTGGGGVGNVTATFTDGYGVTSIARQSNTSIRVTFASAFATANYSPKIDTEGVSTTKAVIKAGRTTTTVDIAIQTVSTGNELDLDATSGQWELDLSVHGRQ